MTHDRSSLVLRGTALVAANIEPKGVRAIIVIVAEVGMQEAGTIVLLARTRPIVPSAAPAFVALTEDYAS